MPKLLFMSGSARRESLNTKLVKLAMSMCEASGAEVEYIDLHDLNLPIYNSDDEAADGVPEAAKTLREKMHAADGYFITSPEYNSGYSALLKNAIDWASRPASSDDKLNPYGGKVVAISASSPGGLGGMRVLVVLRMLLSNLGAHVVPNQAAIGNGFQAFDETGALKDEKQAAMFKGVVDQFLGTVTKLTN
jgi:NAD(P)H-dependent FMN reductase